MSAETTTLLPCPFCGSSNLRIHKGSNVYYAYCCGCGAQNGWAGNSASAITSWNLRPADPVKVALAEALECHRDSYRIAHELQHSEREALRDAWIQKYPDAWHNSRFAHMSEAERLRYMAEQMSASALAAYREEQKA